MTLLKMKKQRNPSKGFTLLELVIVMVLLGVMAVGITSFVSLTTQTYVNVTARDEIIASARFAIERLNREIRNAVPNSIRVANVGPIQCIEFVPIVASTVYTDIPVSPETAASSIAVIPFENDDGSNYQCSGCDDKVIVYPLTNAEVYDTNTDATGKVFSLGNFTPPGVPTTPWTLPIANGNVLFDADSPTNRLYIANEQISYCVLASNLIRYNNSIGGNQPLPPSSAPYLMAQYLAPIDAADLPFTFSPATLRRNASVKVKLHFINNGEDYVFDNEIHINNVP